MLVLHVHDALLHTSTNGVAQILSRHLGMDVAEINGPVYLGISSTPVPPAVMHHGVSAEETR